MSHLGSALFDITVGLLLILLPLPILSKWQAKRQAELGFMGGNEERILRTRVIASRVFGTIAVVTGLWQLWLAWMAG